MSGYTTEIQPTMVRTVEWVRSLGFDTTDSGDGVLNVDAGMEGALHIAHVFVPVSVSVMAERADLLWSRVRERGLDRSGAAVEALYSPGDGIALVVLYGVTDANLGDAP